MKYDTIKFSNKYYQNFKVDTFYNDLYLIIQKIQKSKYSTLKDIFNFSMIMNLFKKSEYFLTDYNSVCGRLNNYINKTNLAYFNNIPYESVFITLDTFIISCNRGFYLNE